MSEESLNPYQANFPAEEAPTVEESSPAQIKLFSAFAVGLATFLGSMFAGSILMGINYRRLGKSNEAIAIIIGGLLATAAYITCIVFFFSNWVPNLVYAGFQVVLALIAFNILQTHIVTAHKRAGGQLASAWWGVLVAIVATIPIMGIAFGIDAVVEMSLGKRIAVNGDEVFISGSATEADGRWLAEKLKEAEWFEGKGAGALLHRSRKQYKVSLFVGNDYVREQETIQFVNDFGRVLADERLGHPLEMRIVDESNSVREMMSIP